MRIIILLLVGCCCLNSPLKWTMAGVRYDSNGSLNGVGTVGYYWSSTVSGTFSRYLFFFSGDSFMNTGHRANGLTVRCLKN